MLLRRLPHRSSALAAALVLAPLLTSCGFNYATDAVDTPGAGVNNREKSVDVLGAMVVAAQPNAGTFTATLSNNEGAAATLTSLSGEATPDDFEPIEVPAEGAVVLSGDDGIGVSGELEAGYFVEVTLVFDTGEEVSLEVPVMTACDEFEGYDTASEPAADAEPYSCEAAEAPESGH
ncbi:hypothetical protein [Nocardioides ferulae]|uniref:hypothetical protein n=1 Tax=Nocardioides ferulae TaxID=2340821 RepID=UPI000EB2C030|nr:hypothetical protein [Nocardioides ferulae]